MVRRFLMLALAGAMTGCAVNPVEIQERGERRDLNSALAPRQAMECMARNADNARPTVAARVREGSTAGVYELVAQGAAGGGTLAFVQARPVGTGSAVSIWISPFLVFGERQLGHDIAAGC